MPPAVASLGPADGAGGGKDIEALEREKKRGGRRSGFPAFFCFANCGRRAHLHSHVCPYQDTKGSGSPKVVNTCSLERRKTKQKNPSEQMRRSGGRAVGAVAASRKDKKCPLWPLPHTHTQGYRRLALVPRSCNNQPQEATRARNPRLVNVSFAHASRKPRPRLQDTAQCST